MTYTGYSACRVPAGSPQGGQFSSCSGGTALTYKDKQWHSEGKPVDASTAARIKALKIPPGWSNVRLNNDLSAPLQAVGVDSKGRTQRRYSTAHSEKAAAEKFTRLKDFHNALPKIRRDIKKDLQSQDPGVREAAQVLHLIDHTGFRIGGSGDTGGAEQAYGASTLLGKHVRVEGSVVHFSFTGKKGVKITKTVESPELANILAAKKRMYGDEDRLFLATDESTRKYLKRISGQDFKVKDFRTWHGTATAVRALKAAPKPKSASDIKQLKTEVARKVAAHLGNTPAVALKSYIDPAVWGVLEAF